MFKFEDLDDTTPAIGFRSQPFTPSRAAMLEAIEDAERSNNIYYSARFNDAGNKQWLPLLKQAAQEHNEHWLAYQLEANGLMKDFEGAQKPSGGYTIKHVPHTAAETMAEGQFNRFYILGLCKRARAEGVSHLIVYRAKESSDPRPESQSLIGTRLSIDEIESELKETKTTSRASLSSQTQVLASSCLD